MTNLPHFKFQLELTLDPQPYLNYCQEQGEEPSYGEWMDWAIEDVQEYLNREGDRYSRQPWGIASNITPIKP
jgi:hypothetical protein